MIGFNIFTAIILKRKDKKIYVVSKEFQNEITEQTKRVTEGLGVTSEHKEELLKKLCKVDNMIAFDKILDELSKDNPNEIRLYLAELEDVIIKLMNLYSKKDSVESAYFPYIIKKYKLINYMNTEKIKEEIFKLLDEKSLYCRENAMQALYSTGNVDCVIEALKKIDKSEFFYHEKLIADGLLSFNGNHKTLCEEIKKNFSYFSSNTQVALLNFFRFDNGDYCEFAFSLLKNEKTNDEVRYSAIRYLGRYYYEPAYEYLLELADNSNNMKWEYQAISSTALGIYRGDRTITLLKKNLTSKNWHIRYNSSVSLERLGQGYIDLIDVLEGNDRYAKEILRYRFDIREISKERG